MFYYPVFVFAIIKFLTRPSTKQALNFHAFFHLRGEMIALY